MRKRIQGKTFRNDPTPRLQAEKRKKCNTFRLTTIDVCLKKQKKKSVANDSPKTGLYR